MEQGQMQTPAPEEIDHAIIEALKVFARRGRLLREQRERAAQSPIPVQQPDATGENCSSYHTSELQSS